MAETLFIALKVLKSLFGNTVTPDLIRMSEPGSSGSRVYIFRHPQVDVSYAVKCVNSPRVSLTDEVARQKMLHQYLPQHVPDVLILQQLDGYEVIISEAKGITLHAAVMQHLLPQSALLTLWRDILDTFSTLWQQTKHIYEPLMSPRYYPARYARITEGVKNIFTDDGKALQDCITMPLVINGREYASLEEIFRHNMAPSCPSFGVLCHGDPQPSNILIARNLDWFIIDWEWAGKHHDWRAMFSHMYGWWPLRFQILLDQPQMYVSKNMLIINYNLFVPDYIKMYQNMCIDTFLRVSERGRYDIDAQDINIYLSMLYFGELRFVQLFGREVYKIPLIAEAVIAASPGDILPHDPSFKFHQKDRTLCIH